MSDSVQNSGGEPPANRWAKPGCVTIRCRQDGPLVVELPGEEDGRPEFRVIDHTGGEFPLPGGRPVALCRCGKTRNKPFCDGSHRASGFEAGNLADDLR